ncbi:LPS assembly protein LptD [Hydrogenophaga sp.]|uniref:LPS-assembly protein LptD n=1 Tax=Hydrogenophaga sp. TaxID=1904254 RepID=UPI0025BD8E41|nr:LPS assembly protein LptD [Hydrogenophaga sp.]
MPSRPVPRFALAPVAAVVVGGMAAWPAQAQGQDPGLVLRSSSRLEESLPADALRQASSEVSGQRIEGRPGGVTTVEGEAQWRRHDMVIQADRLSFDEATREATAEGHVRINRGGDVFTGPSLKLNVDTFTGRFEQPQYEILRTDGRGDASRLDFEGEHHATAYQARYSTCPRTPGADWMPAWLVRASKIEFDNVEQVGAATGGVLEFKGVPILGAPYFTFPLSDERKSGLLPPSINLDNVSGLEFTQPYYLNLAPNYDLTLYPTLMSRRGVDLGGEFRYLRPSFDGNVRGSYMPGDKLRDADRWGYALQHNQQLTEAFARLGASGSGGVTLNLNRVSDDNYWRDFPRANATLTQRLLPSNVELSWYQGPWSLTAGSYSWQTLQDVDSPITPPYDRLPAIALTYGRDDIDWGGIGRSAFSVQTAYTRFESEPTLTGQPNGERTLLIGQVSHRWQAPGWYLEPRARMHTSQYRFDSALSDGSTRFSRSVPTVSLDGGLVFERPASYFGRDFVQTLEPRAFVTWTPYRDQSLLPNYDSAATDFNFATIFAENAFTGNDRISDTRGVTLGVSSRLLDPSSGAEIVRLGVAQRYLLQDQTVTLPNASGQPGGDPVTERFSDVLVAARVQWSPRWLLDTNFQYNPGSGESVRTTLAARYTPGPFRVFSAAWRLQRGTSEQFDFGWQWPLSGLFAKAPEPVPGRGLGAGQWYSVGRINYSVPDRKIVDLVAGFEYDAGCWIGRIVVERLQRSASSANQRILFQLEFSGFSRIGSNPLQTLKDNVPRYQYLREEIAAPSRFQRYD